MRRLWFGGSFNPIHFGHLICARAVAEIAGFDKVVLVPSSQPPHKKGDTSLAPAIDRAAMCRLAVVGDDLFDVDDLEMRRPGASFTIDTVRELKRQGTEIGEIVSWLIGADMAQSLPGWHQPIELLAEVHFVLMARPGWSLDWNLMPPEFRHLQHQVVNAPLLEISSTDIRRRASQGRSIQYLTPNAVVDYIQSKKLYAPPGL